MHFQFITKPIINLCAMQSDFLQYVLSIPSTQFSKLYFHILLQYLIGLAYWAFYFPSAIFTLNHLAHRRSRYHMPAIQYRILVSWTIDLPVDWTEKLWMVLCIRPSFNWKWQNSWKLLLTLWQIFQVMHKLFSKFKTHLMASCNWIC